MGTLVRAIAAGFYNGQRVRPGKEFTLADGIKPGKWMQVVQEDVPAKSKADTEAETKAKAKAKAADVAARVAADNAKNRNIAPPADDLA
jgi:hypothetical protein